MNKPDYISKPDWELLTKKFQDKLEFLEEKIHSNYPVQYLIGDVDFLGNIISINEDVLIPRFETELLVEKTIKILKNDYVNKLKILDIGTGSGCIAISLAKALNSEVWALDISSQALKVAKSNAKQNNVKIHLIEKDILKEELDNNYDVIISNPPYVKEDEKVDPQTKYEPQIALFAKSRGLEFYEQIVKKSVHHLKQNGILAFEIGMTQAGDIANIINKYYPKANIIIEKDYNNRDRFIFMKNKA